MDKTYDIKEAGKYLTRSTATLQRWDRNGTLPAKRTSTNRRYYTQKQLDDCLVKLNTKHNPLYYFDKYTHKIEGAIGIGRKDDAKKAIEILNKQKDIFITSKYAGEGKMTLIKTMACLDSKRQYHEVDFYRIMEKCTFDDGFDDYLFSQILSNILKTSFSISYLKQKQTIALVFDEFTQLFMLNKDSINVAVNCISTPLVSMIMLDTQQEYDWYIKKGRLEKAHLYKLPPLHKIEIVQTLTASAKRYGVYDDIDDPDKLFKVIYDKANNLNNGKAVMRNAIILFDNLIGFHRALNKPMNKETLNEILKDY